MRKKLMKVEAPVEGEIANLMVVLSFPPAGIWNPPTSTTPFISSSSPPPGVAGARGLHFRNIDGIDGIDDSAKAWPDVGQRDADSVGYFSKYRL